MNSSFVGSLLPYRKSLSGDLANILFSSYFSFLLALPTQPIDNYTLTRLYYYFNLVNSNIKIPGN